MIVTTSLDETGQLVEKATRYAKDLSIKYVKRNKQTIKTLQSKVDEEVLIVNDKRGLSYYGKEGKEVFFHPNMAIHRIHQLKQQQPDGLVTACQLEEGMSFLDMTLGLGSDTLVAMSVVKASGKVVSVEKSFALALLVKEGLKRYAELENQDIQTMIHRLNIINDDNLNYLKILPDNSFDVVYFDFMFLNTIESSSGISVIKSLVSYDQLTQEHVEEAKRVAKKRIVVKSSYKNEQLTALGFEILRKNQKRQFLFATMNLEK